MITNETCDRNSFYDFRLQLGGWIKAIFREHKHTGEYCLIDDRRKFCCSIYYGNTAMMNKEVFDEFFATVAPHQKVDEAYFLFDFLKSFEIKTIVEIGTATGGMASMFCRFFPGVKVISIDIGEHEEARRKSEQYGFEYIIGDSSKMEPIKTDLLLIDGSHEYPDVKKDFEIWGDHAKIIALHDIVWNPGQSGMSTATVWKFWNELREKYKPDNVREIICSAYGGTVEHSGIGIVW